MFWQDKDGDSINFVVPDDIVDVLFSIDCRSLPCDHAYALSTAVLQVLPWLADESLAGIHLIHGAESGAGWVRPEDVIVLSRRNKLTLRLPKERIKDAEELVGKTLDISGNNLIIGKTSIRKLSKLKTIFSRYIVYSTCENEADFLKFISEELQKKSIEVNKIMPGKMHELKTPSEILRCRSVMISDLTAMQSVQIQTEGIGEGRKLGCGIFLPHKGIDTIAPMEKD
jgi:CRISPR-associated protein Cas6